MNLSQKQDYDFILAGFLSFGEGRGFPNGRGINPPISEEKDYKVFCKSLTQCEYALFW